jgi:hypothetical protein
MVYKGAGIMESRGKDKKLKKLIKNLHRLVFFTTPKPNPI